MNYIMVIFNNCHRLFRPNLLHNLESECRNSLLASFVGKNGERLFTPNSNYVASVQSAVGWLALFAVARCDMTFERIKLLTALPRHKDLFQNIYNCQE